MRRERGEAPPPAGARRAQANKAPLRTRRPPPPRPPRPPPGTPSSPPPRQRAPCVPHLAPPPRPQGTSGTVSVKGACLEVPTDRIPPHPARCSTAHANSHLSPENSDFNLKAILYVRERERNPREKSCRAKIMQPRHPISTGRGPPLNAGGPVSPAHRGAQGWGSPAMAAQTPSPGPFPVRQEEMGESLRRPGLHQPQSHRHGALPFPHSTSTTGILVNLGTYSTSLSLTVNLYPQRKLKIADGFLHLYPPLHHHHVSQSDCRRRRVRGDSRQEAVTEQPELPR